GALLPVVPPQCVEPVRQLGPCPGEDGKSPGRTSPRGQSRYVLDLRYISRWAARARAAGHEKGGAPRSKRPTGIPAFPALEMHRRRQKHLSRVAVVAGQYACLAQRRDGIARAVQDVRAGVRVLQEEVV